MLTDRLGDVSSVCFLTELFLMKFQVIFIWMLCLLIIKGYASSVDSRAQSINVTTAFDANTVELVALGSYGDPSGLRTVNDGQIN